jgi:hypothetical protein
MEFIWKIEFGGSNLWDVFFYQFFNSKPYSLIHWLILIPGLVFSKFGSYLFFMYNFAKTAAKDPYNFDIGSSNK